MKGLAGYLLAMVVGIVAVLLWMDGQEDNRVNRERMSILQARVAEAETQRVVDSVEVVKRVTITKTLRDSFIERITDTVIARQFIYQTDTLGLACLACTESASRLRVSYDSLARTQDSLIAAARPSWKQRFGISCGYSLVKVGNEAKLGPSCGAAFRLWP